MEKEDITHKIIGAAYEVFNALGFGFLESVYKRAMVLELRKQNTEHSIETVGKNLREMMSWLFNKK